MSGAAKPVKNADTQNPHQLIMVAVVAVEAVPLAALVVVLAVEDAVRLVNRIVEVIVAVLVVQMIGRPLVVIHSVPLFVLLDAKVMDERPREEAMLAMEFMNLEKKGWKLYLPLHRLRYFAIIYFLIVHLL